MPPEPVAGITALGPPLSTPAAEATVAPGVPKRPAREPSRGRLALAAVVVGAILVVVASIGWATRSTDTAVVAQASTTSTPDVATRPSPTSTETATPSLSGGVLSATDAPSPSPSAVAIPATVALPKLSATVPGATKIRYFSVVGDSPSELIDQVVVKSKPLYVSSGTAVTWPDPLREEIDGLYVVPDIRTGGDPMQPEILRIVIRGYAGDGIYTGDGVEASLHNVPARSPRIASSGSILAAAHIETAVSTDPDGDAWTAIFGPCTATISDGGTRGSITCAPDPKRRVLPGAGSTTLDASWSPAP
jgi:hypothetical protein